MRGKGASSFEVVLDARRPGVIGREVARRSETSVGFVTAANQRRSGGEGAELRLPCNVLGHFYSHDIGLKVVQGRLAEQLLFWGKLLEALRVIF